MEFLQREEHSDPKPMLSMNTMEASLCITGLLGCMLWDRGARGTRRGDKLHLLRCSCRNAWVCRQPFCVCLVAGSSHGGHLEPVLTALAKWRSSATSPRASKSKDIPHDKAEDLHNRSRSLQDPTGLNIKVEDS